MAVSFKVPSSPAKSIFTIDEFLGVDLTNSPANIQDNRSPNAPNMTRLVPGKVRKRMGYEKEVLFGTRNNVNFAKGTSCEEQIYTVTGAAVGTWIKIYDLIERMVSPDGNAFTVYFEFDYKAPYTFYTTGNSHECVASEEWTHESFSFEYNSGGSVSFIAILSNDEQDISIKNFSVMYAKDSAYKWSPAPNRFIDSSVNAPVYGFHKYVTTGSDANIMLDINRAIGTGTPITLGSGSEYTDQLMYYLTEDIADGRSVIVKFDYEYVSNMAGALPNIHIGKNSVVDFSEVIGVPEAQTWYRGTYVGEPTVVEVAEGYSTQKIMCLTTHGMTLIISNLSVLYAKSDSYTWKAAPEDSSVYFKDMPTQLYEFGDTNYADSEEVTRTGAGSDPGEWMPIFIPIQSEGNLTGYSLLSMLLTVEGESGNISGVDSRLILSNGDQVNIRWISSYQKSTWTIKVLLCPSNHAVSPKGSNWSDGLYIDHIEVNITTTGADSVLVTAKDISLVKATQKEYLYDSSVIRMYHVGDKIYSIDTNDVVTEIASNVNNHKSMSWQFGQKLFLLDGKNSYLYDYSSNEMDVIGQDNAYIPLVTISKSPTGGGTSFEPLNLLQPGFYEQFICRQGVEDEDTAKDFYMSFNNLDNATVRAWVLDSNGIWREKYEDIDFTVIRYEGQIHFVTAPGATPISGEDNVKILAYRTVDGYADRIKKCTFGTLFGVNGASDRLFLSGNPDYPNYDWYSEQYDPTYFPDTGYSALGVEISAIVGYSLVNNYLATHKDDNEPSQSVFIREGDLVKRTVTTSVGTSVEISEPAFKLINTLQGASALTPYTFGYLQTEPLFLTKSGVFALTTQDITGDKYGQDRSFYLNGALMSENGLEDAYSCVYDNMYYLAVNNKVYLLDGLQATRTDRSDPYSTRQYVGFLWNNIPAVILWTDEEYLFFGTADGKVCRFHKDVDALESYNDDGFPIDAWWETPDLDGKLFYKNKTFRYYAARLMSALATSVKMWTMKAGAWTLIKTDNQTGRYFDFENIDFEKFTFSTDQTEKVVHTKIKVKKADKARFKLENDALNEPFGLFNIALEYVENGNYKG